MPNRTKQNKKNNLLKYRLRARLSQAALAYKVTQITGAYITSGTISNIEQEKRWPRNDKQEALAKALGLTVDDLFPLDDEDGDLAPELPMNAKIPA